MSPVRLEQDRIDLLEIDGFGLVAHGFDECADAEVSDGPERAFGAAGDEVDGFFGEGGVGQADAVELGVDEVGEVCCGEGFEFGGVGDAGFEVVVEAELEGGVERGLADQDEVVIAREVFQQEAELAQGFVLRTYLIPYAVAEF